MTGQVSLRHYEGLNGFGQQSAQDVAELTKALEAGYQVTNQTGGSALRVESLEASSGASVLRGAVANRVNCGKPTTAVVMAIRNQAPDGTVEAVRAGEGSETRGTAKAMTPPRAPDDFGLEVDEIVRSHLERDGVGINSLRQHDTLKVVTYTNHHIKLWKRIPKSPALTTENHWEMLCPNVNSEGAPAVKVAGNKLGELRGT